VHSKLLAEYTVLACDRAPKLVLGDCLHSLDRNESLVQDARPQDSDNKNEPTLGAPTAVAVSYASKTDLAVTFRSSLPFAWAGLRPNGATSLFALLTQYAKRSCDLHHRFFVIDTRLPSARGVDGRRRRSHTFPLGVPSAESGALSALLPLHRPPDGPPPPQARGRMATAHGNHSAGAVSRFGAP
jgi:hypothetical protein